MTQATTDPAAIEAAAEQMRMACKLSPSARFEAHGAIKPKVGPIVKPPELRANWMQRLESDIVTYCLLNQLPIRLIRLKPRQKGSSTWSVWKLYSLLSDSMSRGVIIGGAHTQGQNLFKILKTYADNDTFDLDRPGRTRCAVMDKEARFSNGSLCDRLTAANGEAGRSGTYQVVVATEYARWDEEGVAAASEVLGGLLRTVPDAPMTMVDIESTANGEGNDFHTRWLAAITFEELKAGRRGYVKIFAPWFVFEDSRRDPALEEGEQQCIPKEVEQEVRAKYDLDDWQVAWMQYACRELCKKDFDIFCEEYPFDEVSAFRTSGRRRFNATILRQMAERARLYAPALGNLETNQDDRVMWRPATEDDCRVVRWEQPRVGCRYLVSVDSMTGESQVAGEDPDSHSVGVWRAGMFEHGKGWVPPKLVARLVDNWGEWERNKVYQLWWDIDVLEEQVWRLAGYYGNCMIVPEMNKDRGLVELLKLRPNAQIYERVQFNRREQTETKAYGWYTDPKTREMIIENLARAIRTQGTDGEGVEIHCPILISELQSFVVKKSGRSEAMSGKHDDTVLEAAIGLQCINGATTYHERSVRVKLPPDLAALEKANRSGTGMAMKW